MKRPIKRRVATRRCNPTTSVKRLARYQLSDGVVMLSKLGRKYFVTRTHWDDSPPDHYADLTKAKAAETVARILRHDVLELD